jgi:saccharopine dehydrogenase (NAD+, L-lysine forming)
MNRVLIVGAGGVGTVVAHKCAQNPGVFGAVMLASRTVSRAQAVAAAVKQKQQRDIATAPLDADNVAETVALLRSFKPKLLINVALPYQDLTLMQACLEAGVDYLDTANYESPGFPKFEYRHQWAMHPDYEKAGVMALLGSGFDPGVTNVFCAYARDHLFDEIDTIDMAAITARRSRRISTPKSTYAKSPSPAAIGKTVNGSKSPPCRSGWISTIRASAFALRI